MSAHALLARLPGAHRVGVGTIRARLVDFGEFPGAALSTAGAVPGEIWEFQRRRGVLREIDAYEGRLFVRKRLSVRTRRGSTRAWAYVLTGLG